MSETERPASPTDSEVPAAPEANGAEPGKPERVLTHLREQYEAATEDRRTIIPIAPGRFDGNLAARYKPSPWTDYRKRGRRAFKSGTSEAAELDFAAGVIAACCETILVRLTDGGEYVPLHEQVEKWKDGEPVTFDQRLCETLGITTSGGATTICRLVFKNPAALNDHFVELDQWLKEASESDEDDEEGGAPPT